MSDFSISAFCSKHKLRFAPDDGGCSQCDDSRCPACGALPDDDGEYPCSCQEEAEQGLEEEENFDEDFDMDPVERICGPDPEPESD